jgi:ABC-type transporter Mla maintaining outer membrane lipid asymmetry ATPase subunit MlaF
VRAGGELRFEPAPPERLALTEFLMLKDGHVVFQGRADELRASPDEYLRAFLS